MAAVSAGPVLKLTRQRRKPVIVGAAGMLLLSSVLMLFGTLTAAPGWVFLVGYVLLALSTVGNPPTSATMKEINRPDAVAVAISVLNTAVYMAVGVLGNAAGTILDAFGGECNSTDGASFIRRTRMPRFLPVSRLSRSYPRWWRPSRSRRRTGDR